ncbi:MAG: GGDEF domain-containing protein [Candidatus Doudnabacteria bacterium]|nr:GGDEF domain-containing protein [Candidatus Doudnabacteria bacterium]
MRERRSNVVTGSETEDLETKITRLEQENEKLKFENELLLSRATKDPLTDLNNRRGLQEAVQLLRPGSSSGEKRESDNKEKSRRPMSVLFLDVDNFKVINDAYGHEAGDQVLKEIAQHLQGTIRGGDVVGRWGGEEFVVVFNNASPDQIQQKYYNKNQQRALLEIKTSQGVITFSGGVTELEPDESLEQAEERADRAMYEAKQSGKNRIVSVV